MKILFLTPRDSRKNLGGVERHVKLLTEELVKRGHQVREVALDGVYKGPTLPRQGRTFAFKFSAWRYLWQRRELFGWAEVVHVHDVFWWVMPFLPIIYYKSFKESPCHAARRHLKRRIFVTFHGWEGRYPPTRSAVWQKRLAARLCDGTIGVGSFFEKWYGVKTDRVVWGVLDPRIAKITKISEKRERGVYKGPTFVFFGRLEEVNGIEVVIEAIKKIIANDANQIKRMNANKRIDFKFIFVGDGSYRKPVESVGKVTGMVEEPWKYLVDAEAVIASSYLAILEAAAMGKRIIAVADNPLKLDYLEGHPLRGYFKVVGSAEELVGEITDKSYKDYKNNKEGERGEGNTWVLGQTAEKLADEYEKLWRIKQIR